MIRAFRLLPERLQTLCNGLAQAVHVLEKILEAMEEGGPVRDRLEALEHRQALWEAEIEAELERAETKYKAARSSEERARGMMRRAEEASEAIEGLEDGEEEIPAEYLALLRGGDGAGSGEGGVQPVSPDMEPAAPRYAGKRARALTMKWGG